MRRWTTRRYFGAEGFVIVIVILFASVGVLRADDITGRLNTFSQGTTISSSQVNDNFNFLARALPRLKPAIGNSVTATSNAQNLATVTVTPQADGSLLLLASAGVTIEQGTLVGGSSWGYSACNICMTQTSNGNNNCSPVVLDTMFVTNTEAYAPRIVVPVTLYAVVPVTRDNPVTYYLTTYFESGSVGTCMIQGSGLTALFVPGGYLQ